MNPVIRKLIAKEIFMNRWLLAGTVVAGLGSLAAARHGAMGFNIGGLTWLTTLVAFGVILANYSIVQERKDRALLFTLSLPLSANDYIRTKLFGMLLCYLIAWIPLAGSAIMVVALTTHLPDGGLPFLVLLSVFLLANYSLVLGVMLMSTSEVMINVVIIVTNMAITLFMFGVFALDGISMHVKEAVPVWNDTFFIVLAGELAVLAVMLILPLIPKRNRNLL